MYPSNFYHEPSECHYTPGLCFDGPEKRPYTPLSHGSAYFSEFYDELWRCHCIPGLRFHGSILEYLYTPLYHESTRECLYTPELIQGSTEQRIHNTTRFFQPLLPDESMDEGKRPLFLLQRLRLPTNLFKAPL